MSRKTNINEKSKPLGINLVSENRNDKCIIKEFRDGVKVVNLDVKEKEKKLDLELKLIPKNIINDR